MSRRLLPLALLLLALPLGTAAPEEESAPSSYASIDGVAYHLASGRVNGSALAHDAGGGERLLDFQGCAFTQFRPGFGRGRVAVDGLIDGVVPVKLEMSDFEAGGGFVESNVTVDASQHPALPEGGRARAEIAARGVAQMHAGIVENEDGFPALGNFTDPVTGSQELSAAVFVARDGSRGEGGAPQPEVQRDDDEIHVVVATPPGAEPQSQAMWFGPPAFTADGSAFPEGEHAASYRFLNTRYGGVAALTVTASARAPPGQNEVTVTVYSPDGFEAANATVAPSILGPSTVELEVPLDQLGDYTVLARGRLLMGNYRIDVELQPAAGFRFDFFWEEFHRGEEARNANSQCLKELGLRAQVVSGSVRRNPPPMFPMELVVMGVVAAVVTGLFLVKLGYETLSSAEFKRSFKK
jgi:hypothetical protein